jgi:hypothetical protein
MTAIPLALEGRLLLPHYNHEHNSSEGFSPLNGEADLHNI